MPKLTKLSIEEGKLSAIGAGESYTFPFLSLFKWDTKENKRIENLSDITEGWQVFMYNIYAELGKIYQWMNTSKIQEVLERTESTITFRTETSVYLLEMEKDA